MKRSLLILLIGIFAFAPMSFAGRADDYDFARGLVEKRFYDLAQEQFEGIINDSDRSPQERANGELGLAYLLKAKAMDARAESKRPVDEVLGIFEEAEESFTGFLTKHPGHPYVTDAKFEVGALLQNKGNFLISRIAKDPENAESYRPKAESAFEQAIELFQGAAEGLEARLENEGLDPEMDQKGAAIDWDRRRAVFYYCVSHYYKGTLFEKGSSDRQGTLEKAIIILTDFVWENEENILGGYAYLYLGLSHKDLDSPDDAMEWITTAYSGQIPDREQDPAKYELWTNLYLQAYYKLAQYCNQLGAGGSESYYETSANQLEEMSKRIPTTDAREFGHRALLEYAKSLMGMGDLPAAMDIASLVSRRGDEIKAKHEWGAGTAFLANRLLNEIIIKANSTGEALTLPPDVLFKAAEGKKSERDWGQAIQAYQQVIKACNVDKAEDVETYLIPSWMQVGECFYRREQYLEAYYAYDRIEAMFKADRTDEAGEAAYYRYRAATQLAATTKDPADIALKQEARSLFAKGYPKHPRSIDLQYYEGADTIIDADALLSSGKKEEAYKLYEVAISFLKKVEDTSVLFERARARWGEIYYKMRRYDEALEKFKWVLTYKPGNAPTRSDHIGNILQAKAMSTYYSALCQSKQKKWSDILTGLADFEKTFSDPSLLHFHAPVMFERVRAYLEIGQIEEAENEGLALRKKFPATEPKNRRTPQAFQLLGKAFYDISMQADPEKQTEIWKKNLEKAAGYFSYFLDYKKGASPEDWGSVGVWYNKLKDWPKAEQYLEKSVMLFQEKIDALSETEVAKRKALGKKVEGLHSVLAKVLLTQKKYAKARDIFETLLTKGNKSALARVRELLLSKDPTRVVVDEFLKKVRKDPGLLEGLARIYMELSTREDLHRAYMLLTILEGVQQGEKYSAKYWERRLLVFRIWLQIGATFKEKQALLNIIDKYKEYNSLGLLDRQELKPEFTKIFDEAQRLK